MQIHIRSKLFSLGVFIAVFLILNIFYSSFVKISIEDEKNRFQYIAANETNYIAGCVDKVVVRTYTLREMIIENHGKTNFFDYMADTIYETVRNDTGVNLRNILLAPEGLVTDVYPLKHNEAMIGFNFMDDSLKGNKEAVEAYLKEKTVITNPFVLMQGGVGVAARTPVFIRENGRRNFWGIVSATMDFNDLLSAFNFDNLKHMNIRYRLWYEDSDGKDNILAQNDGAMEDSVSMEFNVYNLKWNLDLKPEDGWYNEEMIKLARIVIFIVSALLSALIMLVFRIRRDGNAMKLLAEQDSLTKAFSRHYLNYHILNFNTGDWNHSGIKYSLAIVDVDKFKGINDTYGHDVGDRALIAVSSVLQRNLSKTKKDLIVRFGGDEFLLFFNDADRKELGIVFHDILAGVSNVHFEDVPELKLSVSIGAVSYENAVSKKYRDMLQTADKNLYEVKQKGKNDYYLL